MVGYANVFFQRKDFDAAIDCILWLREKVQWTACSASTSALDEVNAMDIELSLLSEKELGVVIKENLTAIYSLA